MNITFKEKRYKLDSKQVKELNAQCVKWANQALIKDVTQEEIIFILHEDYVKWCHTENMVAKGKKIFTSTLRTLYQNEQDSLRIEFYNRQGLRVKGLKYNNLIPRSEKQVKSIEEINQPRKKKKSVVEK